MPTTDDIEVTHVAKSPERPQYYRFILAALVALALLSAAIDFGIRSRVAAANTLARATEQSATPIVNVVHPKRGLPLQKSFCPAAHRLTSTRQFTLEPMVT
jgi:hypothetical protein